MAIKHIPDGGEFEYDRSFGFHGSAEPAITPRGTTDAVPDDQGRTFAKGGREEVQHHANGGHSVTHEDGRMEHHYANGGSGIHFPDGTVIMNHANGGRAIHHADGSMEIHNADGSKIIHHAHGGHSVYHADGGIEQHHAHGGRTMTHPDGTIEHHDGSEYAHGGSDAKQDKMIADREVRKGISQHESHEHKGEHTDLSLRRGGNVRLPRSMKPQASRSRSPIGGGAAPKRLSNMVTPRNQNDGTGIGYGVEPSAEANPAGSEQTGLGGALGGAMMRRGGQYED